MDCHHLPAPRGCGRKGGAVEPVDVAFALVGLGALLAGILPRVLERRPLSMPIAFLALGMLVFAAAGRAADTGPAGPPGADHPPHRDRA